MDYTPKQRTVRLKVSEEVSHGLGSVDKPYKELIDWGLCDDTSRRVAEITSFATSTKEDEIVNLMCSK